jgi:hypothetical protein
MNRLKLMSTASIHPDQVVDLTLKCTLLVSSDDWSSSLSSMPSFSVSVCRYQPWSFRSFSACPVQVSAVKAGCQTISLRLLFPLLGTCGVCGWPIHSFLVLGRSPKIHAFLITVILMALRSTLDVGSETAYPFPVVGYDVASGFADRLSYEGKSDWKQPSLWRKTGNTST